MIKLITNNFCAGKSVKFGLGFILFSTKVRLALLKTAVSAAFPHHLVGVFQLQLGKRTGNSTLYQLGNSASLSRAMGIPNQDKKPMPDGINIPWTLLSFRTNCLLKACPPLLKLF